MLRVSLSAAQHIEFSSQGSEGVQRDCVAVRRRTGNIAQRMHVRVPGPPAAPPLLLPLWQKYEISSLDSPPRETRPGLRNVCSARVRDTRTCARIVCVTGCNWRRQRTREQYLAEETRTRTTPVNTGQQDRHRLSHGTATASAQLSDPGSLIHSPERLRRFCAVEIAIHLLQILLYSSPQATSCISTAQKRRRRSGRTNIVFVCCM